MGPTNVALVKLFRADQALREAQGRLDAATRHVRVQEGKVVNLAERQKAAQAALREVQSRAGQFELEIKSRDARIDKLRSQQQNANNNKEYQAFLIEISTEKVDRSKAEDELIKVMEQVENATKELNELIAQHDAEAKKAATMRGEIDAKVAQLKSEVDALRPARDAAAVVVPARQRQLFERLAERYEGEAMSALAKPDPRREEYLCSACNMELVADIYNRLHTRDDLVDCKNCGRILYIPEDLPPEVAVNSRGKYDVPRDSAGAGAPAAPRPKRGRSTEKLDPTDRRAKGKLGDVLSGAQGESVKIALDAGLKPVELDVTVDGRPQGIYKGRSAEHLQRVITLRMDEANLKGDVTVTERAGPEGAGKPPEAPEASTPAPAGEPIASNPPSSPHAMAGDPQASTEPQAGAEQPERSAEQTADPHSEGGVGMETPSSSSSESSELSSIAADPTAPS